MAYQREDSGTSKQGPSDHNDCDAARLQESPPGLHVCSARRKNNVSDEKKKKVKRRDEFSVTASGQVVNSAGVVVTNNPMAYHRPWIKLWVDPWLDGTTRWQTTGAQRAFWADLMCEAARSRFPGYICAGQDAGQIIGYPVRWYEAKQTDEGFDVMATLVLFERTGKVRMIITKENPELVALEILNWSQYQPSLDDAARARKYRDTKKKQ